MQNNLPQVLLDWDADEPRRRLCASAGPLTVGMAPNNPEDIGKRFWFKTDTLTKEDIKEITSLQLVTLSSGGLNEGVPGLRTWFELRIRGSEDELTKRLPNGQSLAWYSHPNSFNGEEPSWCQGRVFTKAAGLFKHLKPGDSISVHAVASGGHTNNAVTGCLLLGFGEGTQANRNFQFHGPAPTLPAIHVYGQKRRECLMIPTNASESKMETILIDGGVDLLGRLMDDVDDTNWFVHRFPLGQSEDITAPHGLDSTIELKRVGDKDTKKHPSFQSVKQTKLIERRPENLSEIERIANNAREQAEATKRDRKNANRPTHPKIIIVDDSGFKKQVIPPPNDPSVLKPEAKVVIYKMNAPLCEGSHWTDVIDYAGQPTCKGVFVVIDMDDIRARGFHISRGISWEKTLEDFRANIDEIIKELDIPFNMHLIIRCGYEGVFWVGPSDSAAARQQQRERNAKEKEKRKALYEGTDKDKKEDEEKRIPHALDTKFITHMVPDMAEGDLLKHCNGRMPGIDVAFITGFAASLVLRSDNTLQHLESTIVGTALTCAIVRSHRFASTKFLQDSLGMINYPTAETIDDHRLPQPKIIFVENSQFETDHDGKWSLFTMVRDLQENVAPETVKEGTTFIEHIVPTARYGILKTADRIEIEGFRSTASVINQYLRGSAQNPLSIAVFGQPGSGKSFGVKQVIKAILGDKYKGMIEANLSQFVELSDLVKIFDDVRDTHLKGGIPVVMFDEFDSSFKGQRLGWLKYFLAPMQDGEYLHSGMNRSLGRAIFVFVGGTSSTFREFSHVDQIDQPANNPPLGDQDARQELDKIKLANIKLDKISEDKQAKKPDFISRLSAHINVAGPNKSKGVHGDEMWIMRRAILLRSLLERRLGLQDRSIGVDETLLITLLNLDEIPNGSRSLELILQNSDLSRGERFQPSALPSNEQLSMHLDIGRFKTAMRDRLQGPDFRPIDPILYRKLKWARWKGKDYSYGPVAAGGAAV